MRIKHDNFIFFNYGIMSLPGGGGGGGGVEVHSSSKIKNNPKALNFGQKSTLILLKTHTFSSK